MKKSHFFSRSCTFIAFIVVYTTVESITTGHEGHLAKKKFFMTEKKMKTPLHKVQMTQRGYIQFLRWELDVPEITEYTFCLWFQSTNLTFAHSFFSYSKNEKDRLIRSWISPRGQSIHLEIDNVEIFQLPFSIQENRWYHLCQSWQSKDGRYAMWIDGVIVTEGLSRETTGHVIPSKGDIVVGQEYTDFDKGLDDGIEGSVLGFNLLLSSAFHFYEAPSTNFQNFKSLSNPSPTSRSFPATNIYSHFDEILPSEQKYTSSEIKFEGGFVTTDQPDSFDILKQNLQDDERGQFLLEVINSGSGKKSNLENLKQASIFEAPLGLQLIILSHTECEIGRGSPFIGGPLMLISWSRTPVRIFGGAIVKNVKGDCGNFQFIE